MGTIFEVENVLSFFTNAGFSISSVFICGMILFAYFLKNREKKLDRKSKYFVLYLVAIIIMCLCEVLYVEYFLHNGVDGIYAKYLYYLYSIAILSTTFAAWMFVITYRATVLLDEKRAKPFKIGFYSIVGIVEVMITVMMFLLPVVIHAPRGVYTFDSLSMTATLIYVFISTTSFIFLLYYKNDNITRKDLPPIITSIVIILLLLVYRLVKHTDINIETFQLTVFALGMFFTVENQDYKLLLTAKQKQTTAEQATQSQREFLSNLSHEIRSPMNTILGLSQLLLQQKDLSKDTAYEDMANIHDASISLLSLINNITDFSYSVSDSDEVNEQEYNVNELMFELNDDVSDKVASKDISFEFSVSNSVPKKLLGDSEKVLRTVYSIISNETSYDTVDHISVNVTGEKKEDDLFELKFVISAPGTEMNEDKFKIEDSETMKLDYAKALNSDILGLLVAKNISQKINGNIEFTNETYTFTIEQKVISDVSGKNEIREKLPETKKQEEIKEKKIEEEKKSEQETKPVEEEKKPESETKPVEEEKKPEPETKPAEEEKKPEPETKPVEEEKKFELNTETTEEENKPEPAHGESKFHMMDETSAETETSSNEGGVANV